jgi:hypothetical protein
MRLDTHEVLTKAINERRTVILSYGGRNAGVRICNPHILYRSAQDTVCVDCYQIGGKTSKGSVLPGWRPFNTGDILSVRPTDETFVTAPGYDPDNRQRYRVIIAHV